MLALLPALLRALFVLLFFETPSPQLLQPPQREALHPEPDKSPKAEPGPQQAHQVHQSRISGTTRPRLQSLSPGNPEHPEPPQSQKPWIPNAAKPLRTQTNNPMNDPKTPRRPAGSRKQQKNKTPKTPQQHPRRGRFTAPPGGQRRSSVGTGPRQICSEVLGKVDPRIWYPILLKANYRI